MQIINFKKMKMYQSPFSNLKFNWIILLLVFFADINLASAQSTTTTTEAGTSKIWGKVDGIEIEGMVAGPSTEVTPLQVACVFEYTEDDIFKSPPALPAAVNVMVHLDKGLQGIITDIRKNGKFAGHALETLLITPALHFKNAE